MLTITYFHACGRVAGHMRYLDCDLAKAEDIAKRYMQQFSIGEGYIAEAHIVDDGRELSVLKAKQGEFMNEQTARMICKWLQDRDGNVESLARWMRQALHIRGIKACRELIRQAQQIERKGGRADTTTN